VECLLSFWLRCYSLVLLWLWLLLCAVLVLCHQEPVNPFHIVGLQSAEPASVPRAAPRQYDVALVTHLKQNGY